MSFLNKRRGQDDPNSGGKKILTAAMFLGKEGNPAYITPQQLLEFVDNARIDDVQEFEAMFDMVKEQLKIVLPRKQRVDKGAMPYKYTTFLRPNSPDGAKVILVGNINQFMLDYRDGKFTTNFTLEDLVNEAEKA